MACFQKGKYPFSEPTVTSSEGNPDFRKHPRNFVTPQAISGEGAGPAELDDPFNATGTDRSPFTPEPDVSRGDGHNGKGAIDVDEREFRFCFVKIGRFAR